MNANFSLPAIPAEFSEVAAICTATEIEIGGRTVFGIADASDLHEGLKVGRDYSTWIKARITKYGFREGVDYEILLPRSGEQTGSGGHNALTYRLTLDMAKELAMVENNDQGRLVRRYFIWADDQRRSVATVPAALSPDVMEMIRSDNGMSKQMNHKITEQGRQIVTLVQAVAALTAIVQPGVPGQWRPGKTAGEILMASGIVNPPKNIAKWLGNRLEAAGCRVEGKSTSGLTYARMFDPDRAEAWMKNGGKVAVEMKIAERRGQGVLSFHGGKAIPINLNIVKDGKHLGYLFADACKIVNDMVTRGELGEAGSPEHEYRLRQAFVSVVAASGIRFPRPDGGAGAFSLPLLGAPA